MKTNHTTEKHKPDWWQIAGWCKDRAGRLSDRESDFIFTMRFILTRPSAEPTPKQAKWLQNIMDRIKKETAA